MKRILLLIFIIHCKLLAQESEVDFKNPDSIQSKTYFELYELFFDNYKENPDKARLYANRYLEKGKNENEDLVIAHGFFLISHLYEGNEICLKYADSIIQLTKGLKNNGLLTRGYLLKGDYFLKKGLFQEAWNNYKKADQIITKKSNSRTLYRYNRSIGRLKSRIGRHKEAIKIFQECYQYASKEELDDRFQDILYLANEFNQLKVLDSASYYNNLGIRGTLDIQDKHRYTLFVLNSGITYYHKKTYQSAIDSISKTLPYLRRSNESQGLITSYFYLGKAYAGINLKDQSVDYLMKMDSVVQIQEDIIPKLQEGYKLLINHFKEQSDIEKESLYLQRQSKIDSLQSNNTTNVLQRIISEYTVPMIVSNKDTRISKLEDSGMNYRITIIVTILLLIISVGIMIYLHNDRKRYRKSFRAVVSYTNKVVETEPKLNTKNEKHLNDLNISEEVIQKILEGMKDFESGKRYLDKKYTLGVLAKELKTNSTYLSKIINIYKEKNFSNYLHDLRIGYAIERLRDDEKFRRYSIKGISEEMGFKTSESFAKAFHKKTGIYPSSFIKKLKNT
ncbi:helix-turn-helix domain-containing protein [Aquimarina sp. Aq78]|uniref:helix-turn-helix domain-containing protein n=1 Tax=Aquimarina sp. Aq78 TaxID=1191889 RepID=UPI000D111468|nr:helix-turn-helix domain-containing protein [Aquimarina sp. Aq78]